MKFKPGDLIVYDGYSFLIARIDRYYYVADGDNYHSIEIEWADSRYELAPICKSPVWRALNEV
jgi:hypothetical protein